MRFLIENSIRLVGKIIRGAAGDGSHIQKATMHCALPQNSEELVPKGAAIPQGMRQSRGNLRSAKICNFICNLRSEFSSIPVLIRCSNTRYLLEIAMINSGSHDVTQLLKAWEHGDEGARDQLIPTCLWSVTSHSTTSSTRRVGLPNPPIY